MTWLLVGVLGLVSLSIRGTGFLVARGWTLSARADRRLHLAALALVGAVIATQTATADARVVVDARAAGMVAAVVAILARASILAVFVVAVAVTATIRWWAG